MSCLVAGRRNTGRGKDHRSPPLPARRIGSTIIDPAAEMVVLIDEAHIRAAHSASGEETGVAITIIPAAARARRHCMAASACCRDG
jgi:hypothetical protein